MSSLPTTTLPDGSSRVVFGLGTSRMVEDRAAFDAEVAALRAGIDLGIRLIDTAEMYGDAECVVGEAISGRRWDAQDVREQSPALGHQPSRSSSAALALIDITVCQNDHWSL